MRRRKISLTEKRIRQNFVQGFGGPAFLQSVAKLVFGAETRMRRSLPIQRYCRGTGIEIGAAASPAIVPFGVTVKYVDKYELETISADPELIGLDPVKPDFVCSAERLEAFPDQSQDFVLAFSLLEHVQNPMGALESFVRVTKPGGVLILSVPDKRSYGPDKKRPLTTFEHFVKDYEDGPAWSLEAHLRESALLGKGMTDAEADAFVEKTKAADGHTHFHVWDPSTFLDFVVRSVARLSLPAELLEFAQYGHESQVILRVTKSA